MNEWTTGSQFATAHGRRVNTDGDGSGNERAWHWLVLDLSLCWGLSL